jgi:DNA invertase Pin-like site-specific DNA recombinase
MKIGYARVSTIEQNLNLQTDALERAGCEKIFTDMASGSIDSRRGLIDAIEFCRSGDSLFVWKLDPLGRSLRNLIDTVNKLQSKGVEFVSLQESVDATTSGGKLVFHVFGALAEFEREMIRERTRAGLKAARDRGSIQGRPKKLTRQQINIAKKLMDDKETKILEITKTLNVSRSTLYRYQTTNTKQQRESKIKLEG